MSKSSPPRKVSPLVDAAQYLKTRDLAGVLRRLALSVVEVGGDRDDGLRYGLAELGFRRLLHLLQDVGGDLGGGVLLAVRLDPGVPVRPLDDLVGNELLVLLDHGVVVAPADQALDGKEGVDRIGDRLALGRQAYQPLAVVRESNDGGGGICAFRVLEHLGLAAFHHRDTGIGGAEVDADHFGHIVDPLFCGRPSGPRIWHPAP